MRVVKVISFFLSAFVFGVNAHGLSGEMKYPLEWHIEEGELRFEVGGEDWRGYETFCLPIISAKQTGARVALDILGENDEILGQIVFVADWVGEDKMNLWLANFKPKGNKKRFADVHAVRLKCMEPGLWPSTFIIGKFEVLEAEPTWQVNDSDVVIDMGWHEMMARPELWSIVKESSTKKADDLLVTKPWPWTEFSYMQTKEPGKLTMERKFDIDLEQYSQMLGKMMWDQDVILIATAIVDGGREIQLFEGGWRDGWYTFGDSLNGAKHLDAVRLSIKEKEERVFTGRKVTMALFYLLLRKPTAMDNAPMVEVDIRMGPPNQIWPCSYTNTFADQKYVRRLVPRYPFEDKRIESNTPIGDPMKDGMPFGLMIRKENLSELRKQALNRNTPAGKIFARIKEQADFAIATELVDRKVGSRIYGGGLGQLKGLMGAGMRVFAPQVAITHLITGDDKYAVATRRWILRAAVSEEWRAEGTGCVNRPEIGDLLPYSDSFTDWRPRGFAGYMNIPYHVGDTGFGTAVAFDMLYHCFSPEERRLVEQGFADKGVYILYDKLRHFREFYVKFNQGAWFAAPLLMQTVFLKDNDPVYAQMHDWTIEFLKEFGENGPYNKEGVLREGAGYGDYALLLYIDALKVMAVSKDVAVSEMLSPAFISAMEFFMHSRSTAHEKPLTLPWSDNGGKNWVQEVVLAFYARYANNPYAQWLWNESYSNAESEDVQTLVLLAANDPVKAKEPNLPPAKVYTDEPVAFLRTGWKYGDTLLAVANIRHMVGHGHKDRASIILEYNGEELILDPGMVNYYNPLAKQYQETFCHNTLTFSQESQAGNEVLLSGGDKIYDTMVRGFISTSGSHCPGRKGGIDWVIMDATAVYPKAQEFQRHIVFLRPDVFVLFDDVEAKQDEMMEINFTCRGPLQADENTFISSTQKNKLIIHSVGSKALKYTFLGWGTSKPNVPSYRLIRSTSKPETKCTFLTTLVPVAVSQEQAQITDIMLEGAMAVRVDCGEYDYLIVSREGIGSLSDVGVETDAKRVVVTRKGSEVVGMAMYKGTNLTIEGCEFVLGGNIDSVSGAVKVEGEWIVEKCKINHRSVQR